ncbi:MAG: hypothetical protein ACI8WB_000928 [Phenylobacterium sp.]|jgi:hypothetical protein
MRQDESNQAHVTSEIVLNVHREDRATVFQDPRERLQLRAYEKAFGLLQTAKEFASNLAQKQVSKHPQMNQPLDRIHNTIFIDGARGSGKTAFMLNLETAYVQANLQGLDRQQVRPDRGLYFSQPIDPTLLNLKEDFINVIIGQIHTEIEAHCDQSNKEMAESYIEALELVTDSLEAEFTAKSSYGVDKLLAFKGSLELERRLFSYFAQAKDVLGCKAIVLLIDDVDMSLDMAFNVLEVIRKYLACPFVLSVVSGDKKLYRTIVTRHFVRQLAINANKPEQAEKKQSTELADRYIQKIFPEYGEIRLQLFPELLKQHQINVHSTGGTISFNRLYGRLKGVAFAGTNGVEDSRPDFLPQTSRDLAQFLNVLSSLSDQHQAELAILFDADKGSVTSELHRSRALLIKLADYFCASERMALYQLVQTSLALFAMSQFDGTAPDGRRALLFRNVGIMDAANHGDDRSFTRFAEKSIGALENIKCSERDKAGQLPYLQTLPRLMVNFSGIEPYAGRLMIAKSRVDKIVDGNERLLLRLYTHNDYYSSYQTGYLLFFGKVFELVLSSIYQDLSAKDIERLLAQAPFHGFFHYFPTKLADTALDEGGSDGSDVTAVSSDHSQQSIDVLAEQINQWRQSLTGVRYSGQLLYSAFNKYFRTVKLLKNQPFIADQSMGLLHQRVKLLLLNAFACFENKSNEVVKQGIAMGKGFVAENTIKGDQSYLRNIKPLLESQHPTLTKVIDQHPLFKLAGLDGFLVKPTGIAGSEDVVEKLPVMGQGRRRLAGAALLKVVTAETLMELKKMLNDNIDGRSLATSVINKIVSNSEMAKYKDIYNRQKTNTSANFYTIYNAAVTIGSAKRLETWLEHK